MFWQIKQWHDSMPLQFRIVYVYVCVCVRAHALGSLTQSFKRNNAPTFLNLFS